MAWVIVVVDAVISVFLIGISAQAARLTSRAISEARRVAERDADGDDAGASSVVRPARGRTLEEALAELDWLYTSGRLTPSQWQRERGRLLAERSGFSE